MIFIEQIVREEGKGESHLLVKLRNLVLRTILKAGHIDGRSESKKID